MVFQSKTIWLTNIKRFLAKFLAIKKHSADIQFVNNCRQRNLFAECFLVKKHLSDRRLVSICKQNMMLPNCLVVKKPSADGHLVTCVNKAFCWLNVFWPKSNLPTLNWSAFIDKVLLIVYLLGECLLANGQICAGQVLIG
jgi:hypothetical protein